MSAAAITHHEILRRVGPLAAHGRHVDLAASDRAGRVLAFRPVRHEGEPVLREGLRLHLDEPERVRLVRTLEDDTGLRATLTVDAPDVAEAAERLMALAPRAQFPQRGPVRVAETWIGGLRPRSTISGTRSTGLALVAAEARVAGLRVSLEAPEGSVIAARLRLETEPGAVPPRLPDDLLAVLGRAWRPLRASADGWKSGVRVTTRLARRNADVQQRFARTVEHLHATLSAPPAQFHQRLRWTRWRVALRRATPLAVSLGLPLLVLGVVVWGSGRGVDWHPLAQFLPPLMLAGAFVWMSRELPVFELPPLPRALPADAWHGGAAVGASAPPATVSRNA